MLHKMSQKLTTVILGNEITQSERSIYVYSFELLISLFCNIVAAVFLAAIFRKPLETIIFCAVFIPIRQTAGGYHASTPFKCLCIWIIALAAFLFSLSVFRIDMLYLSYILILPLTVISVCIVWRFAPIPHKNKPINGVKHELFKKKSRIVSTIAGVCTILFLFCPQTVFVGYSIMAGLLSSSLSLFAEISLHKESLIKNKE